MDWRARLNVGWGWEVYSGPEQSEKDVPIERQLGVGCRSPSRVRRVPTRGRDSSNNGRLVTWGGGGGGCVTNGIYP